MDRSDWRQEIQALPVFDTHTHLNMPGVPIPARDFWDIAHYFWFQQELWSVGYPIDPNALPESERIERFVDALHASRNTIWNGIVREMFHNLYEIDLVDAASVREADTAVRASFQNPDWSRQVVDRLAIRKIAVNNLADADYPELPGIGVAVPSKGSFDRALWSETILAAQDRDQAVQAALIDLQADVNRFYAMGICGMRVDLTPLQQPNMIALPDELPAVPDKATVDAWLTHALFRALGRHGMFAQFFVGISSVSNRSSMAVNDPTCIPTLYPLFERHACGFEIVVGAPQMNLDAAQAARIYPNVHLGGLWWYNFRSSTYRQTMQVRLEAVPASKSSIVASDARCIEWCYGKILLVKRLLAYFLFDQVKSGWLDRDTALWVAREWLHDAAARRYLPQEQDAVTR